MALVNISNYPSTLTWGWSTASTIALTKEKGSGPGVGLLLRHLGKGHRGQWTMSSRSPGNNWPGARSGWRSAPPPPAQTSGERSMPDCLHLIPASIPGRAGSCSDPVNYTKPKGADCTHFTKCVRNLRLFVNLQNPLQINFTYATIYLRIKYIFINF